jgi:hypothetical protein
MMVLPPVAPRDGWRFSARLAQQIPLSQFEHCGEAGLLSPEQSAHKCPVVPRLPCISHRTSSSSCLP